MNECQYPTIDIYDEADSEKTIRLIEQLKAEQQADQPKPKESKLQTWECDSCDKTCKRYTDGPGDFPAMDGRLCIDAEYPGTKAHYVPIEGAEQ